MAVNELICPDCRVALRIAEEDLRVGLAFDCPDCRQPLLLLETAGGSLRAARRPTPSATDGEGPAPAAAPWRSHNGRSDESRGAGDSAGRDAPHADAIRHAVRQIRCAIAALTRRWLDSPVCVAFSAAAIFTFVLAWTTGDSPPPSSHNAQRLASGSPPRRGDVIRPASDASDRAAAHSSRGSARAAAGTPSASGSDAAPTSAVAATQRKGKAKSAHTNSSLPPSTGTRDTGSPVPPNASVAPTTSRLAGGDVSAAATSGEPPGGRSRRSPVGQLFGELSEHAGPHGGNARGTSAVNAQSARERTREPPPDEQARQRDIPPLHGGNAASDPVQLRAALATPVPEFTTTRPLTTRELLLQLEQLLGHPITFAQDTRTQAALSAKIQVQLRGVDLRDLIGEVCRRAGLQVSFEPHVSVRAASASGSADAAAGHETGRPGTKRPRHADRVAGEDNGSR